MRTFQSFFLLLLLFQTTAVCARKWSSKDLPSPQNDPNSICGRGTLTRNVCDPDGFISQSDADTIDGLVNFASEGSYGFKRLPCKGALKGAQMAVAVVESMAPGSGSEKDRAFQFAKDLHDRWDVGDADCQNGVVIFLAVKDRAIGAFVGAGIKSIFTDVMGRKINAVIKPKLRNKEYGQGIADVIVTIGTILSIEEFPESFFSRFWIPLTCVGVVFYVYNSRTTRAG